MTEVIAIYGGSFDPLHLAHESIVQSMLVPIATPQGEVRIDKFIMIPNYQNPLKNSPMFEAVERLEMCKIFLHSLMQNSCSYPYLEVSEYEIKQNRAVYSIESIEHIYTCYGSNIRLLFVLGMDSFATLARWKACERICDLVEFVLICRASQPVSMQGRAEQAVSGIATKKIGNPHNLHARVLSYLSLPDSVSGCSSSIVRRLLNEGRQDDALRLCPASVQAYIRTKLGKFV